MLYGSTEAKQMDLAAALVGGKALAPEGWNCGAN